MKKARAETSNLDGDGMRDRYDFSGGVRGKYAARYAEGVTIVIGPDTEKVSGKKLKGAGSTKSRLRDSRNDKPVASVDAASRRNVTAPRKRR